MSAAAGHTLLDGSRAQPGGTGRIPSLDGLRAIAVAAVMLFHTAGSPFAGGYLGVDIFFVLSGFLIAGILVDQWHRAAGIALTEFWLRRARRLAPALLLLLLTLAVARLAVAQTSTWQWRAELFAALTYTTNWFEIVSGADYFAAFGVQSPLLHTWSLAIEEQFYLLFAVALLFLLPRLRRRGLVLGLSTGVVLSAVWMAVQAGSDPVAAYYSTFTRIQALLVGAVLAVIVRSPGHLWWAPSSTLTRATTGWLASAILAGFVVVDVPMSVMFHGGFLTVAVVSALLIWSLLGPAGVTRVLSWRPLVLVGTVSYGVYLWHWPIFLWLGTQQEASIGLQIWAMVLTIAVAMVSYVAVERPIRQGRFSRLRPRAQWTVYAIGAAFVAGLALLPARVPSVDGELVWPAPSQVPARVFVGGDSTMFALGGHFPSSTYPDTTVGGPTAIGCGLVNMSYDYEGSPVTADQCFSWPDEWERERRDRNPDVAVIGSAVWDSFNRSIDGVAVPPGDPAFDEPFKQAFRRAIQIAGDEGRVPTYVLTIPCMNARIDQEILNDPERTRYLSALIGQAVAEEPNAHVIDLEALTCRPDGSAVVFRDGVLLRDDGVHWTQAGAREVWSLILEQIAADGVTDTSVGSLPSPSP